MSKQKLFLISMTVLLGAGCMLGPNYKRPETDLPAAVKAKDLNAFTQQDWWAVFGDPVLNALEKEALTYNYDLQAAIARVDEARADVGIARADQMPSLSGSGSGGREGSKAGSGESTSRAGVSLSFELDLWGKYRRLSEAARARLLASQAARDTVRLTLTADVANNYFNMLMLDEQIRIATRTLEARQETVRVYESRYKNGYSTEVDLRRVQANRDGVQAQLQSLQLERSKTETALSVLLGQSPRQMIEQHIPRGKTLNEVTLIPDVPADLPSDLLERRPDIRQAEGELMAANADIGAARASYFPSISLTAATGFASAALGDLLSGASGVWNAAAGLTAPIFEGGKIRAQNKKAEAQYREQLADYQKTVQLAFKEAFDALNANRMNRQIYDSYKDQTTAMQRSYDLTKKQEDAGLIGVTDLLDVEENLLSSQMNLASSRANELQAVVNLCKALGGGWTEQKGFISDSAN